MVAQEKKDEGAQFVKYLGPLLTALGGLGGSAKAEEAVDRVAEDLNVPDEILNDTIDCWECDESKGKQCSAT